MFNNKVVTFSGTAPTPAATPGGYTAPHLLAVQVFVNAATTAQGQCYTAFDMDVTPS